MSEALSDTPVRILVVEDERIIARDIADMLKRQGYSVPALASTGVDAVRLAAETDPDLLLMDIHLAGEIDGVEAARQITARRDIPIVYVTAHNDNATLHRATRGQSPAPFGYLLKPFTERDLYSAIEVALHKAEVERDQKALYQIAQATISSTHLGELYASIHTVLRQLAQAENFAIALVESARGIAPLLSDDLISTPSQPPVRLVFTYVGGHFDPPLVEPVSSDQPGYSLASYVWRTGRPILAQPELLQQIISQAELPAACLVCAGWAGVPLTLDNRIIGVMLLQSQAGQSLDGQTDLDLLTFVSTQVALAIERKRAEAQAQRQLERLTSIRAIDVAITTNQDVQSTLHVLLEQLGARLNVDATAVLLLNPNSHTLEYAAQRGFHTPAFQQGYLSEGHAMQVMQEQRALCIPDLASAVQPRRYSVWVMKEGFVFYYGLPLAARGKLKGVLEVFQRQPFVPDDEWIDFLEALAGQAAIAVDNAAMLEELQSSNVDLIQAYNATIEGWARALEMRDRETEGHSRRVTEMTIRLATALGVQGEALSHIRRGALLHDIGKMGIPDGILLKPGKLTPAEWEIMRQHPVYAYELLSPISFLRPALDIPYYHHEKWNGSGYPSGLKGEQIPLAARIFAVIDVWDALSSDRPYQKAWPADKILELIREQSGTHFDPQVVDVFLKIVVNYL